MKPVWWKIINFQHCPSRCFSSPLVLPQQFSFPQKAQAWWVLSTSSEVWSTLNSHPYKISSSGFSAPLKIKPLPLLNIISVKPFFFFVAFNGLSLLLLPLWSILYYVTLSTLGSWRLTIIKYDACCEGELRVMFCFASIQGSGFPEWWAVKTEKENVFDIKKRKSLLKI